MFFQRLRFDNIPWALPTQAWQNGRDAVIGVLDKIINTVSANPLPEGTGNEDLDELIEIFGYAYDPEQDIFISRLHPWQRKIGYCRLFDELSPLMGMIIDCEPIYFSYNGKKWLLGLWKGQYDMVTGGEIGLYKGLVNFSIPDLSSAIYYRSAGDDELLSMSFTLKKNGQTLLTRDGTHWWLTGFKLGEFSDPSELSMDASITLANEEMRNAFIQGLKNTGYKREEYTVSGNAVSFTFDVPHTPQPLTRTKFTDWIIQKKNKFLCDEFLRITGSQTTIQEKVRALENQSPEIYQKLLTMGGGKPSLEAGAAAVIIAAIVLYLIAQNNTAADQAQDQ
jgi:hypothetical protein